MGLNPGDGLDGEFDQGRVEAWHFGTWHRGFLLPEKTLFLPRRVFKLDQEPVVPSLEFGLGVNLGCNRVWFGVESW